jgi:DNA-directed RNA polymerase subunit F
MPSPQFVSETPLALVEVKSMLHSAEQRDGSLNFLSNKAKEHQDLFITLPAKKREELYAKLTGLNLTRLKEEHYCKIIDFLPQNLDELKVILQSYPLSLPKKDQESLVAAVIEVAPK